ncbi:hypothetical protein V8D89_002049 [Ganoderma adspersum]
MSSEDESPLPAFKKRKVQRACDYCRRKKSDGPEMPNNRCSNCTTRRAECTYLQDPPNKHKYSRSYVEDLESRLERMEKFVNKARITTFHNLLPTAAYSTTLQLVPNANAGQALDVQHPDRHPSQNLGVPSDRSHASGSHTQPPRTSPPLTVAPPSPAPADNGPPSEVEEAELDKELTEAMRKLSMHSQPFRYHGKSSGLVFIRSALALKNQYASSPPMPERDRHHPWLKDFVNDDFPVFEERVFPPRDLLDTLVDLYFRHMNNHFPLLHEPTFKNALRAGQHLRDGGFGATVLLVCAIGSRFTRDPRVLLPDSDHPHSAGWRWFRAVEKARRLSFAPAGLHDLQVYALMALFLDGSNASVGTWAVIGAGIRAALEVGVHRKNMYAPTPNVDEELWRRAFWVLVFMEWLLGYGFGRPCSIHDEDFDLAFPTECDDEYWLTPEGTPLFKQPPDKPSMVSGFVQLLKLGQALAFANRTIYATNKSRAQLGHSDQQWEQRIVAELDSALNQWANSLPSHLRWNPEQENLLFLSQAATIAAVYYLHQIAVHRSFMSRSSSPRESPISPLSTIICVNAARSAIQVIEVLYNRTGNPSHRNMKRSGGAVNVNTEKDLAWVRKCVEMLRSLRYEMHIAETLADILTDVMSGVTGAQYPSQTPGASSDVQEPATSRAEAEHEHLPPREAPHLDDPDSAPGPAVGVHLHMHDLDLDVTLPGMSSFTTPFRPDGFEQFAKPTPMDGLTQRDATEQGQGLGPPPLAQAVWHSANLARNGLLPAQGHPPTPSSHARGDALAGATSGEIALGPFGTGTGQSQMFGLEAVGTSSNESMPAQPPVASQATLPWRDYLPPLSQGYVRAGVEDPPGQRETGIPEFMVMDDTLAMWPSMSPIFGWEEWGEHFANADSAGT